jgi:hypothetical protein
VITFLGGFKYLAAVLVALSVPAFGLVALTMLMFCDHGPVAACFLRAALIVAISVAQIISLVTAWSFLKKRHRIALSAGLMTLSVLPVLVAIFLWMRIRA